MKKSLLALAVAALATTASAATVYDKDGTSVDMYGRVQSVIYSTHTGNNNAGDDTMRTSARFGLDLRQQVTPGFAVLGKAEWDTADGQDHNSFAVRYMWVGADFGQFGTVKAGRFEDAVKYVLLTTDVFDDWGCNAQVDNDDKRDSMFGYTWTGYGFTFNVTAGMASDGQQVDGAYYPNGDKKAVESQNINDSYAVSVGYKTPAVLFGPIDARLGYGHVDFQDEKDGFSYVGADATNSYDSYDNYAVSLGWGELSQGLYLGALYNARSFDMVEGNDIDVSGAEGVVGYSFANGLTTRIGVNYKKYEDGDDTLEYVVLPVFANYQVSPAFNVWAEARFDLGSDKEATKNYMGNDVTSWENLSLCENVYSVGARYTF